MKLRALCFLGALALCFLAIAAAGPAVAAGCPPTFCAEAEAECLAGCSCAIFKCNPGSCWAACTCPIICLD